MIVEFKSNDGQEPDQNYINSFFEGDGRFNEWINFTIVYDSNVVYIYYDFQLIFHKNHTFNNDGVVRLNYKFSSNTEYNYYDCLLLWRGNKIKTGVDALILLFTLPLFYTSNGIATKNKLIYNEYNNRVDRIESLKDLLRLNRNRVDIDTSVNICTRYTDRPYGTLIVNDVSHDLQNKLDQRQNTVVITNNFTYNTDRYRY